MTRPSWGHIKTLAGHVLSRLHYCWEPPPLRLRLDVKGRLQNKLSKNDLVLTVDGYELTQDGKFEDDKNQDKTCDDAVVRSWRTKTMQA